MKCKKCGAKLEKNAVFCYKCGTKVKSSALITSVEDAVREALDGNEDGFSYLYDKTYKSKYYVALKYIKDEDKVADVLQDSYIKAFKKLDTLKEPAKFDSWLGMIVANKAKDYLKVKNPVLFTDIEQNDDDGNVINMEELIIDESVDSNPEEKYSKQETAELVNELLECLPNEQKMCMIMFYFEGLSIEEIATALDCSKNTVTSRLNYGRKKIKIKGEELEKKGYKLYNLSPVTLLVALMHAQEGAFICGAGAGAAGAVVTAVATAGAVGASSATGLLGMMTVKVAATTIGLALFGGAVAGAIMLSKDKKEATTEVKVEATTEVTTEEEVTTEKVKVDADKELRKYLEDELIPKYKIYDPGQTSADSEDMCTTVTKYNFNKDTLSFDLDAITYVEAELYKEFYKDNEDLLIYTDYCGSTTTSYENLDRSVLDLYDYTGIYEADIKDFDNDGQSELLIVRRSIDENVKELQKDANRYNIIGLGWMYSNRNSFISESSNREGLVYTAELYEVESDKVSLSKSQNLYADKDGMMPTGQVYIMTIDNEEKLITEAIPLSYDMEKKRSYYTVYSTKDLQAEKYIYGRSQHIYSEETGRDKVHDSCDQIYTVTDIKTGNDTEYYIPADEVRFDRYYDTLRYVEILNDSLGFYARPGHISNIALKYLYHVNDKKVDRVKQLNDYYTVKNKNEKLRDEQWEERIEEEKRIASEEKLTETVSEETGEEENTVFIDDQNNVNTSDQNTDNKKSDASKKDTDNKKSDISDKDTGNKKKSDTSDKDTGNNTNISDQDTDSKAKDDEVSQGGDISDQNSGDTNTDNAGDTNTDNAGDSQDGDKDNAVDENEGNVNKNNTSEE